MEAWAMATKKDLAVCAQLAQRIEHFKAVRNLEQRNVLRKALGAKLRALREAEGLTQASIGRRIGRDPNYICGLESGVKLNPTPALVEMILKAIASAR
jgi:hypothetical protein